MEHASRYPIGAKEREASRLSHLSQPAHSRSMRALTVHCLIAAIVSCAGCASVKLADGIEPTRMRRISPGEARHGVEAILGPPIKSTQTAVGTLVTYGCDLGLPRESLGTGRKESATEPDEALRDERFLAARNAIFSFMFLGFPEIYAQQAIAEQKGTALVTYDQQDRVTDSAVACRKPAPDSESFLKIY